MYKKKQCSSAYCALEYSHLFNFYMYSVIRKCCRMTWKDVKVTKRARRRITAHHVRQDSNFKN